MIGSIFGIAGLALVVFAIFCKSKWTWVLHTLYIRTTITFLVIGLVIMSWELAAQRGIPLPELAYNQIVPLVVFGFIMFLFAIQLFRLLPERPTEPDVPIQNVRRPVGDPRRLAEGKDEDTYD